MLGPVHAWKLAKFQKLPVVFIYLEFRDLPLWIQELHIIGHDEIFL